MNILFAYLLITVALAAGTPRALTDQEALSASDASIAIANVLPGSPAEKAGLMPGDIITYVEGPNGDYQGHDATSFTLFVGKDSAHLPLTFHITRNGAPITIDATPQSGIIPDQPWRIGLGVAVATVGTVAVPWYQAPIAGAVLTWELTKDTAVGLAHFFGGLATLSTDLSQVTGPVGIAGAVGSAYNQGFTSLLTITAIISINLALINLIPIPALDGGRLLFVIIEAITRKPIKPSVARAVNTIGFALLILLMVVVTAHDVFKLFA